jgi:ribosome-interacting GTPase 1
MKPDLEFVLNALEEKRIKLVIDPPADPEDVRFVYKRTMICGHKEYEDESGEMRRALEAMFPGYPVAYTSILDDQSLDNLKRTIFQALRIIRVYTKQIGKDVEMVDPVVLPTGGTVEDAALEIHKDFAHKLKFAKLWGHGKFEGQRITRDEVLNDGDIVEFHI